MDDRSSGAFASSSRTFHPAVDNNWKQVKLRRALFLIPDTTNTMFSELSAAEPPQVNPGSGSGAQSNGGNAQFDTLDPNVVIILVVLLFALICAAFLNSMMRCLLHRSTRGDPPDAVASTQGLGSDVLRSLPIFTYCVSEKPKDRSPDCAICLSEFVEKEKVRLLPKCNHVFHLDCIDMWLLSHDSCPVCRDAIADEAPEATSISIPSHSVLEESVEGATSTGSTSNLCAELLDPRSSMIEETSSARASQEAIPRRTISGVRSSLQAIFTTDGVPSFFAGVAGRASSGFSRSSGASSSNGFSRTGDASSSSAANS